jgi:hypothetical protein
MNVETVLLTFGEGSQKYRNAANRLAHQASCLGLFSEIITADFRFIEENTPDEYLAHRSFLETNSRGCGYWLWKPIIIKFVLEKLTQKSGQKILLYVDSGCEVFAGGIKSLERHLLLANTNGTCFFKLPYHEAEWTKADLFEHPYIDIKDPTAVNQIHATYFFLTNTDGCLELARKWLEIAIDKDYHYLNDSPSLIPNHSEFKEHRHDQSILSCLVHSSGISAKGYGYEFARSNYFNGSPYLRHCIHSVRNLSGTSVLTNRVSMKPFGVILINIKFHLVKLFFRVKVFWARHR